MDRFAKISEVDEKISSIKGVNLPIDIEADLSIDWQNDLVPGTEKTYAQKFGNIIFKAVIVGDDGSGNHVPFEANLTYTVTDGLIDILDVQNILYPGKLTFI